jgi:hypothetical protein
MKNFVATKRLILEGSGKNSIETFNIHLSSDSDRTYVCRSIILSAEHELTESQRIAVSASFVIDDTVSKASIPGGIIATKMLSGNDLYRKEPRAVPYFDTVDLLEDVGPVNLVYRGGNPLGGDGKEIEKGYTCYILLSAKNINLSEPYTGRVFCIINYYCL